MGGTATSMTTPREQALFDAFERGLEKFATQFVEELEHDIKLGWSAGDSRQIGKVSIPIRMRFQLRALGFRVGYAGDVTRRALARKVGKLLSEKMGCKMVVSCNWHYSLEAHEQQ